MIDKLLELLFVEDRTPLAMATLFPFAFEVTELVLLVALRFVPEFSDMRGSEAADLLVSGNIDRVND